MDIVQRIFRAQIQRETSAVHAQQMGGHSSGTKVVNAAVHSLHADGAFKRSAIVKGEVFTQKNELLELGDITDTVPFTLSVPNKKMLCHPEGKSPEIEISPFAPTFTVPVNFTMLSHPSGSTDPVLVTTILPASVSEPIFIVPPPVRVG